MKSHKFTMVDAVTIIVFCLVLVAMLFPTKGGCRRFRPQTRSMNNCKQIMTGIAVYFSDVRKKKMPKFEDVFGSGYESQELFNCPAGGGITNRSFLPGTPDYKYDYSMSDYGYTGQTGDYKIIDTTDPAFFQAKSTQLDTSDSWLDINHSDSPIISTYNPMRNASKGQLTNETHSLQPVAFGDGHAEICGRK